MLQKLINYGLTKSEAILYITLLKNGESKVGALIKAANFRSGKIYQVLDYLLQKGLITFTIHNNVRYYSANDPLKILNLIQDKKRALQEQELSLKQELPLFRKISSSPKVPCSIKVYEGVEGMRAVLHYFYQKLPLRSTIFIYGANDDLHRDVVLSWKTFEEIRSEKNLHLKIIMTQLSAKGREMRRNKKHHKEYRYLFGMDIVSFMLASDMVLLFNFTQQNCILIENQDYTQQFKNMFNFLWKIAKPL